MNFPDVISQRRAVNFFDPEKEVPEALLRQVIELAASTPSSFNLQPWSLIVLTDEDEKMRLRKHAMNQPKVSEAPVTLIVLADREGWMDDHRFVNKNFDQMIKAGTASEGKDEWYKRARKKLYGANPETELAFACKNTAFFAMTLMLAAQGLGLNSHPMDGFDQAGVKEEFNIPDNYWVPVLISLGYFDESKKLAQPKWRKTYDEIVVSF